MYPTGLNIVHPASCDVDSILSMQSRYAISSPLQQQRYGPIPAIYPNDFYSTCPPDLRSVDHSGKSAAYEWEFMINASQSFAQNQQMAYGAEMVSYTSADPSVRESDIYRPAMQTSVHQLLPPPTEFQRTPTRPRSVYPPTYSATGSDVNLPADGYQGLLRHSRSAAIDDCSTRTSRRRSLAPPPAMNYKPLDWIEFQQQQRQQQNMLESCTTRATMHQPNMAVLHADPSCQIAHQPPVGHQGLTTFPTFTGPAVHNETIRLRQFTQPIWYSNSADRFQEQQQMSTVEENHTRQTQIPNWNRSPSTRYFRSGFTPPPHSWLEPSVVSGAKPNARSQHFQQLNDSQLHSERVDVPPMEGVCQQLMSEDCNDSASFVMAAVGSLRQPNLYPAKTGDQLQSKTKSWSHATPQINTSTDVFSIPKVASPQAERESFVSRHEVGTNAHCQKNNLVDNVSRTQRLLPAELFGYHYWLTCETVDRLQCCLQLLDTSRLTSFSSQESCKNVTATASKLLQKLHNDYVQLLRATETRPDLLKDQQWQDLLRDSSSEIENIRQSLKPVFTSITECYYREDQTPPDSATHRNFHTLNQYLNDFYICLVKFLQVGSRPWTHLPCENAQISVDGLGSDFATSLEASGCQNTCVDTAVANTAFSSNKKRVDHSDPKYINSNTKQEDRILKAPVVNHAQQRVEAEKTVSLETSARDSGRPYADEKEANNSNVTSTKDFQEEPWTSSAAYKNAKRNTSCTRQPEDDSQKNTTRLSESNIRNKNGKICGLTGQPAELVDNSYACTREVSNKSAGDATFALSPDGITTRSIKQEPVESCSVSSNIFDQLKDYIQTKRKTAGGESPSPSCAVKDEMRADDEDANMATTATFCSTSGHDDVDKTVATASTSAISFFTSVQRVDGRQPSSQQSLQYNKPASTSRSVSMELLINEVLNSGLSPPSSITSPHDSVTCLRQSENDFSQTSREVRVCDATAQDSGTSEKPHFWSAPANVDSCCSKWCMPVKFCLPAADETDSHAISNCCVCCDLMRNLSSNVSRICADSFTDTKTDTTQTTEDIANYSRDTKRRSEICCEEIESMADEATKCLTKCISKPESQHKGSVSKSLTAKVNPLCTLTGDSCCDLAATGSLSDNVELTSSLETEFVDSSSQQTLDPTKAQQQQVEGSTFNIDSTGPCRKRIAQLLASSSEPAVKKQLCSTSPSSLCRQETGTVKTVEQKELIVSSAACEQSQQKTAADSSAIKSTTEASRKSSQLQLTASASGSRQRHVESKSTADDHAKNLSTEKFSNLLNNSFVQPSNSNSVKDLPLPSSLPQRPNNSQTKSLKTTNIEKFNYGLNAAWSIRPREATNQRQIKLIDPEPVRKPVRGRRKKEIIANGARLLSQPLTKTKKTV